MSPKLLVALCRCLASLGSGVLGEQASTAQALPDVPLVRCIFARAKEVLHDMSPNERRAMAEFADKIQRWPMTSTEIPEIDAIMKPLALHDDVGTASFDDFGAARTDSIPPSAAFDETFKFAAKAVERSPERREHRSGALAAPKGERVGASDEPNFDDSLSNALPRDSAAPTTRSAVADEPAVAFSNEKFKVAATPNLLLRFRPGTAERHTQQPRAASTPLAPANSVAEPRSHRVVPSSLTAPPDLAGSLVLD